MDHVEKHPQDTTVLENLIRLLEQAADAAQAFVAAARPVVAARIAGADGKPDRRAADQEQHVVHGYGWYATYAELMRQVSAWAGRLEAAGELRQGAQCGYSQQIERGKVFGQLYRTDNLALVHRNTAGELRAVFGEEQLGKQRINLTQFTGGIAMNQGEIIRPVELTEDLSALDLLAVPALRTLTRQGGTQAVKTAIAKHLADSQGAATLENCGLEETLDLIRDQFFTLVKKKVAPHAHEWHLADQLIPIELVEELGAMGVFGIAIPEEFGGLGMGKTAMCVVSEELSRGWIGVGSLATRAEIAAELILAGGTAAQKAEWLPGIASGEILPTAVFTEPDTGSDLGALRTRATLAGGEYRVTGNKTWITHAARADVMTLLVRTDPTTKNYSGLSMLMAFKQRGTDADPFPTSGMTGGEIEVIGYRGMKEYEIGFDDFPVPAANLLGGIEGQGFKQLMATFESARIQTAARAVGVAQAALDMALAYALDRKQFGGPIFQFPRVANKLAIMAAEIMGARQLTYYAARAKDEGRRCDLEAGMGKLIGARVAWAAADNALQIHGGNGFATEYPVSRLLADARILNIFEGAGEIQAQVIARRLLDGGN